VVLVLTGSGQYGPLANCCPVCFALIADFSSGVTHNISQRFLI
jgi:hypothetical protein